MNCTSPFGKGLLQREAASRVCGSSSVQAPSGALGAGSPKRKGLAETLGSFSAINAARRWKSQE
jgi:hypothetical protein